MLFGRVISVGIGYLCGMFLSGFLYGKKENVDLRKVGSGNVGTTNTMRNLGVKAGILTLIGDVCKVFMAMVIVWLIFRNRYPDSVKVLELYAGVGCILGHDFPAYMKFKGGKGIACSDWLLSAGSANKPWNFYSCGSNHTVCFFRFHTWCNQS